MGGISMEDVLVNPLSRWTSATLDHKGGAVFRKVEKGYTIFCRAMANFDQTDYRTQVMELKGFTLTFMYSFLVMCFSLYNLYIQS
jgi:hypothetical protein